jgi:hypothetical protein
MTTQTLPTTGIARDFFDTHLKSYLVEDGHLMMVCAGCENIIFEYDEVTIVTVTAEHIAYRGSSALDDGVWITHSDRSCTDAHLGEENDQD